MCMSLCLFLIVPALCISFFFLSLDIYYHLLFTKGLDRAVGASYCRHLVLCCS